MRVTFECAPWVGDDVSTHLEDIPGILQGSWLEAAEEFFAARLVKESMGRKAPKGLQPYLNRVLEKRFEAAGWSCEGGRYWAGSRWVRITFRHQMSIGSDIVDSLSFACRSSADAVAILAADERFLRTISPNDAGVLTSFEKLRLQVRELAGCLDIPLVIGRLEPASPLPDPVARVVMGKRERDVYVPKS